MWVGRGRVAEPAGVVVDAHLPSDMRTSCRAPSRRPAPRGAAHPDRPVADVVGCGGEAELRAADGRAGTARAGRSRAGARAGPTCGVSASLAFDGAARPARSRGRQLAVALHVGWTCSAGQVVTPALRPVVEVDRPDVEAAARERARGEGDPAAVAAPGGHRDDLLATRQPPQAAAVAADDVQARRGAAALLADEDDSAAVGRPVGLGVGPAVVIVLARRRGRRSRGDDELRASSRRFGVRRPRPRRRAAAAARGATRSGQAELLAPCGRMLADRADGGAGSLAERLGASARVATGPTQTSSSSKSSSHSSSGCVGEDAPSSAASASCAVGVELPLGEVGPADHLAEAEEELRLERGDRQVAAVGRLVDPVAGEHRP